MDSAACTARCPVEDGGGGGGGGGGGATGLGGAVGAGTVDRGRLVVGTGVAGVFGRSAAIFVAGAEASLDDVPPDARFEPAGGLVVVDRLGVSLGFEPAESALGEPDSVRPTVSASATVWAATSASAAAFACA